MDSRWKLFVVGLALGVGVGIWRGRKAAGGTPRITGSPNQPFRGIA